jgi:hypothetical protein
VVVARSARSAAAAGVSSLAPLSRAVCARAASSGWPGSRLCRRGGRLRRAARAQPRHLDHRGDAAAYCGLHQRGLAHSYEIWRADRLVGGVYGVRLGRVFFGESMFSRERDASKAALAGLVERSAHWASS